MDIQYTQFTQQTLNTFHSMIDGNSNISCNSFDESNINITKERKRKLINRKERKNNDKRKQLKCIYCDTKLNSKYSFCPECGNEIQRDLNDEEIENLKKKHQELEKKNEELEIKLREFQTKQIHQYTQQQIEEEKIQDLMWLVVTIPKPLFPNEKIEFSDYIIRKISPSFSEFLGFVDSKQLINSKMAQILAPIPQQISHNHSDFVDSLASKEESSSFSKDEVFKTLYDEFYLSNLQFNLYSSDSKPSLCIIVLTSLIKISDLESAISHLKQPCNSY